MQKYLFLFTISPVQSFIEQARKTHDLFAGSRILSNLITYAMEQVKATDENVEFIFPTLEQDSKPNRFIVIVHTDKMQQFGDEIQTLVSNYFVNELGSKVIKFFPPTKVQLEDFLKIYWVGAKYDENGDYPTQIKQLERHLGAVKNIRYFEQFPEKGRKCSMNGEYNVQFYRRGEDEADNDRLYKKKLFQDRSEVKVLAANDFRDLKQKDLNKGEGLCAVSMLKRLFDKGVPKGGFPSTARIALLDTLTRCPEADDFLALVKSINGGTADEQIYYESNTTESYFRKHGYLELLSKCSNVETFRKGFDDMKQSIKKSNLKLSKYYAILAFDADGMGNKLQHCKGAAEHTRVSELLAKFASLASDYINDKAKGRGKVIYAGGDDFLGFINHNSLFDVVKDLRQLFDEVVNANLRLELQLTFSAGVAVAHYKTPLSEVLRWAKQMEKTAKKVLHKSDDTNKKDAFSIAVLKRSGEIHFTTWRWKTDGEWTTDLFKRLIGHLKNGELSKKFITNLSSEYEKRLDKDGNWGDKASAFENELNEMLRYEVRFFVKNAKADGLSKEDSWTLADKLYQNYHRHLDFKLSVQNFLNMLHICEFISRELNPIEDDEESKSNTEIIETEKA